MNDLSASPIECFGVAILPVPAEILVPKNTWKDAGEFEKTARKLAEMFAEDFRKYADGVSKDVRNAGPAA